MISYVVGFAYDQFGAVAMILKNKPAILAGKWNGVGGKVEPTDVNTAYAMSREFHEETGQLIPPEDWRRAGEMHTGMGLVSVFTTVVPLLTAHTTTSEPVRVFTPAEQCLIGTDEWPCMENIQPLFALTQMGPGSDGRIPKFALNYL